MNPGDQKQHSVVITGASRGIGRRIALAFARETNFALLLIARTKAGLRETKELCEKEGRNKVEYLVADLSKEEGQELIIPGNFPTPKILINNAGSFLLKSLEDTSHEEFAEQIGANLYSAVHVVNRFLDELKQKDHALIINICSVGSIEGLKDSGAYSASKHALLGYTRSLRQELMGTNIGVTAINLGQTQSTSWEGSSMEQSLLIDPDDVAQIILNLTHLSPRTVVEEILVKPQHGRVPPM